MPHFKQDLKNSIKRLGGSTFWIKATLTSSAIPLDSGTPLAITTAATGRLFIKNVILQTDATGLAGGTNFELATTNVKGKLKFAVETVANLGANVTKQLADTGGQNANGTVAAGTFTVQSIQTVLEEGQTITAANSVGAGTGAGTIDVYIQFERIDENATIQTPVMNIATN
jgi:hypothetical protein